MFARHFYVFFGIKNQITIAKFISAAENYREPFDYFFHTNTFRPSLSTIFPMQSGKQHFDRNYITVGTRCRREVYIFGTE